MDDPNVEASIADLARAWTHSNVVGWEWTKVNAFGRGEVEIRTKDAASSHETLILGVTVSHPKRHVYLTNIMMPQSMKRRGLGKALISSIRDVSTSAGYALFATGLVQGFYDRLVQRGATVVVEGDVVMITAETDLTHWHE